MNWLLLIIAGCYETGYAFCLVKIKGLTGAPWYIWGTGFLICLSLSMTLLSKVVQTIPIGTEYPVWSGIGAVGTVIVSIILYKREFDISNQNKVS